MRAVLAGLFVLLLDNAALAQSATPEQKAQLAPTGALRAAIVTIPFMAYETPPAGMKAMREGAADVIFLAPTPERISQADFAPAFMEMELSLLVPEGSPIQTLADADQPGRRIVVYERSANEEMVRQTLSKATRVLVPLSNHKKAIELIRAGEADAFADLLYQVVAKSIEKAGVRGAAPPTM